MAKNPRPAVGIDLGTTYSCVAVWKENRAITIANNLSDYTTPSSVAFTDHERLVGKAAISYATLHPKSAIFDSKRLIGRRFTDPSVQEDMKMWPFEVIEGHNHKPVIVVQHQGKERRFHPEEISAMVLTKMKETAEAFVRTKKMNVVITVPAYFNNSQRQATIDAGKIAGIDVVRIINEPTAAALAYGLERKADFIGKRNVLVFDLGGGTLDVSLVSIEEGNIVVKAVTGDCHLGGQDFNNRMVEFLVKEFQGKHQKEIGNDPKALKKLRTACEEAKRHLSESESEHISIDCLFSGIDYEYTISRATFERLNMDYFERCIELVDECLRDGHMNEQDVHDIVLVGGSSRIPKIQEMLKAFFNGKELCKSINPDEAVAHGAAAHAAKLSCSTDEPLQELILSDVTPLSLGVLLLSGEMSVIIPRNSPIPIIVHRDFWNSRDNQTEVDIVIFEGEKRMARDNHQLGKFVLSGIRPALERTVRIRVCFDIDDNGILHVTAKEKGTGIKNQITITNSGQMSQEEIDKMIQESEEYKVQDEKYRNRAKVKNSLENFVDKMAQASSKMAPPDKIEEIQKAIAQVTDLLKDEDSILEAEYFEVKLKELESLWNPIIDGV